MKKDRLSLIGSRIKELRSEQKMTLRELAKKSRLSPGLISKIENFRTMPSISVLIEISNSLQVDISEIVKNINVEEEFPFMLVKHGAGEAEPREDSPELDYTFLLSQTIGATSLRVSLVKVPDGTYRKPVATNASEVVYVIAGAVEYTFGEEVASISCGDTLYFDGRVPHAVINKSGQEAVLFKVYLIGFSD